MVKKKTKIEVQQFTPVVGLVRSLADIVNNVKNPILFLSVIGVGVFGYILNNSAHIFVAALHSLASSIDKNSDKMDNVATILRDQAKDTKAQYEILREQGEQQKKQNEEQNLLLDKIWRK